MSAGQDFMIDEQTQLLINKFDDKKDLVLFDLDQTLCDTEALLNKVFQENYRKYLKDKLPNFDSNIEQVDKIVIEYLASPENKGTSLEEKFRLINTQITQELEFQFDDNCIQELNNLHFQNNLECIPKLVESGKIKVFAGIRELLENIKAKGQKIGIYSNRDTQSTLLILESLGLIGYFDLSLCPSEISFKSEQDFVPVVVYGRKSKPDPYALSELSKIVPNKKIARYFGDGPADTKVTERFAEISGENRIETVIFRHQKGLEPTREEKINALRAQQELGVRVFTSPNQFLIEQEDLVKRESRNEIIRGNKLAFA
jgi:phosphoglycolate phosphatase-like HAD superfamily hydrolase